MNIRHRRATAAGLIRLASAASASAVILCSSVSEGGPAQDGAWTDTTSTACTAIHAVVLRGQGDSTQVLFWGDERDFVSNKFQTTARVWRYQHGASFSLSNCFSVPVNPNIFCAGHAVLPDGRLFVPGGEYNLFTGINDTHIYSPTNASWTWQPNMSEPRWYPTATALPDGKMLVVSGEKYSTLEVFGGQNGSALPDTLLQLAILDSVTWGRYLLTPRPEARKNHTTTFDTRSSLSVMFGGETVDSVKSDIWVLKRTDHQTGTSDHTFAWTAVSPTPDPTEGLPPARSLHTAVFVAADTLILIYGGRSAAGQALSDIWSLKVRAAGGGYSAEWTKVIDTGRTPYARFGHSAVYYGFFQKMIVFGGYTSAASYSDSLWTLDLPSGEWQGSQPATSPKGRSRHAAVLTGEDSDLSRTMIVAGGADADSCMATVWSTPVQLGLFSWTQRTALPAPRRGLTLAADPLGPMLAIGGESFAGSALNDIQVMYVPSYAGWYENVQLSRIAPRAGHTAVYNPQYVQSRFPSVFTPQASGPGSWSDISSAARVLPTYPFMFVAPNGKVFMAGPGTDTRYLDVANGAWDDPISASYGAGSAVMYAPGKILRLGHHFTGGASDHAEQIDLTAGSPAWSHTMGMTTRSEMNSTMVPTGEVYVTGGNASGAGAERRPQRWKPGVGWGPPLASEAVIRAYHSTALLLPDGRILSAGGSNPDVAAKRTASIYTPPYLYNSGGSLATRPVVSGGPAKIAYGQTLTFCTSTTSIGGVALIRPSAVTHAFNEEQRFVPLQFSTASSPSRVFATAPSSAALAPPGHYFVFVVGQDSVPAYARWIELSGTAGVDSCDATPPAQITSLSEAVYCTRIELTWTAPADDGNVAASGTVKQYDLRSFPRATITNPDTFAIATQLAAPTPSSPGSSELYAGEVGGCSQRLYYAIRAWDDGTSPNIAPISNRVGPFGTPCPPPECEDALVAGGEAFRLGIHGPDPNPTSGDLRLSLEFPVGTNAAEYTLVLYDLFGRRVGVLEQGAAVSGRHPARVYAVPRKAGLRSGVYVVRLEAGGSQIQKKIVIVN